jgi:hypothetical protein
MDDEASSAAGGALGGLLGAEGWRGDRFVTSWGCGVCCGLLWCTAAGALQRGRRVAEGGGRRGEECWMPGMRHQGVYGGACWCVSCRGLPLPRQLQEEKQALDRRAKDGGGELGGLSSRPRCARGDRHTTLWCVWGGVVPWAKGRA